MAHSAGSRLSMRCIASHYGSYSQSRERNVKDNEVGQPVTVLIPIAFSTFIARSDYGTYESESRSLRFLFSPELKAIVYPQISHQERE